MTTAVVGCDLVWLGAVWFPLLCFGFACLDKVGLCLGSLGVVC